MTIKRIVIPFLLGVPVIGSADIFVCDYAVNGQTQTTTYKVAGGSVISTTKYTGGEYAQTLSLFLNNQRWLSFGIDNEEAEGMAVTLIDKRELASVDLTLQWRGEPYALNPSPANNGICREN
jgi:hypothetical protein